MLLAKTAKLMVAEGPDILVKLHTQCQHGIQQASTDDYIDAPKIVNRDFHDAYLIIGALDDCSDQTDLLVCLAEIANRELDNVQYLLQVGESG